MKTFNFALLFLLLLFQPLFGQDFTPEIVGLARNSSLVIECSGVDPVSGDRGVVMSSAVVFNKNIDGKVRSFILSCSHGVSSVEQDFHAVIYIEPLKIRYKIKPIMYSSHLGGNDFVLYYCDASLKSNVKMSKSRAKVGERIFHIGTPLSITHFNSVFDGIVSRKSTLIKPSPDPRSISRYDTASYFIRRGCSGGGVFNSKGEYIGMNLINLEAGWSGFKPVEYIKKDLKDNNMSWLYNEEKVSMDYIKKIQLTDIGVGLKEPKPKTDKEPNKGDGDGKKISRIKGH